MQLPVDIHLPVLTYLPANILIPGGAAPTFQTLFSIVKEDLTKFFAVFLVFLVGFAGGFLLVLQMDRANIAAVREEGGMVGGGADNTTV